MGVGLWDEFFITLSKELVKQRSGADPGFLKRGGAQIKD